MPLSPSTQDPRRNRHLAASGALYAAAAVALSAYAAHATDGSAQARLQTAAVFAFGHGVALVALAPVARRGLARAALLGLSAGALLFSGSIAGNVLAHWPATLAPIGGMLMIAGWLLLAIDLLRR